MSGRLPATDGTARVLLVDGDPTAAPAVVGALTAAGYVVRAVSTGAAARAAAAEERPDLVVLELLLPDGDGLVLCAELKAAGASVLICSATRRRRDRLLGFRLGADDFVARPCDLDELVARAGVLLRARRAALRSPVPAHRGEPPLQAAGEAFPPAPDGPVHRPVPIRHPALSPAEARLFAALSECRSGPLARRSLAGAVLGRPDDGSALAVLVWRLRAKLAALGPGAPRIATVQGFGYALVDPSHDGHTASTPDDLIG
jgi:DNA-binding response OmpR family regulator